MSYLRIAAALAIVLLAGAVSRAAEQPIYDIPRVDTVPLDGKGDAWSAKAFRVDALCDSATEIRPRKDSASSIKLAWNDEGLIALVTVTDRNDEESNNIELLWKSDCVEFFVASKVGGDDVWQLLVAPGFSDRFPEPRTHFLDGRKTPELKKVALDAQMKRTKTADGYVIEALLPWKNLGIKPAMGEEIGFQIYVDDVAGRTQDHSSWFPQLGAGRDTKLMQRVRLADHASPPAPPAVWGTYERFHDTRVNIIASGDLAGKSFVVRQEGADAPLFNGKMNPDGDRSIASVTFAMPPVGKPYAPLHVAVEGQPEAIIDLGDPEPARAGLIVDRHVNFHPAVFMGEKFPAGEIDDAVFARDLLGPYTITTTYYDGQMNKVETAAKPGRYAALVDIATADGKHFNRFVTLYRSPKSIDDGDLNDRGIAALTDAGIDPVVANNYRDWIPGILGRRGDTRVSAPLPVLLAAMSEIAPTEKRNFTIAWNPSTIDRDYWYQLQKKTGTFAPYKYLDFMPDGYDADKEKKWPLFVILHGSGAQGDDLSILKREHVVPETLGENAKSRKFIVVTPQCHGGESWNVRGVVDLIDELSTKYRVDPDRIYLAGGSMGGFGAWAVAMAIPDRLAALAPLCGGADPADAALVKDLPVWIFHGDHDLSVSISWSNRMFAALSKIGARTRYTIYTDGSHDIADQTYHEELFNWLLEQRRGQPAQGPTTQPTRVPADPGTAH